MQKKIILVLFIFSAFFISSNAQTALDYYNKAYQKYINKDYLNAIKDFNEALKINSEDKGSYFYRADAKIHLGDTSGACDDLEKAYSLGVSNAYSLIQQFCIKDYEKRQRLSDSVNSHYPELAPIISPDGKTIYFTRAAHPENIGANHEQDIWYSNLLPNGEWSKAKNIGPPLNNDFPNHVHAVTPDGNTLLLGSSYITPDGNNQAPCMTHRIKDGWSFPERLIIKNFYNLANFIELHLTDDGKTLLMAIQRKDSYGGGDIYACFLQDDGSWSEPLNLGPTINTSSDELSPFIASDGVSLYFSSAGHGGYGWTDVFVSRRLDDSWTNWSKPENLGSKINSPGFDGFYKIPASGEYAYFVSMETNSQDPDIYRILLPEAAKPNPVVLVYGKVLNSKTKEPVEARVKYEILPKGKEAGIARSNPVDGSYKITLPYGKKYGFRAEADGYLSVNANIDLKKVSKYTEIEKNLELVPIEKEQVIRLNNLFFDFGKTELHEESFPELDRLVKSLNDKPAMKIKVAGYTDNVGSNEANLKLSEERAKAVMDYLISKKIDTLRLSYKGFGKSNPVANNKTDEGRQMNRRVEFIILEK